jgi:hypothetical protein
VEVQDTVETHASTAGCKSDFTSGSAAESEDAVNIGMVLEQGGKALVERDDELRLGQTAAQCSKCRGHEDDISHGTES